MSEAEFQTFLTGGLMLLIALLTLTAWHLWRMREEAKAGRDSALEGVAHELRINLKRMVSEISQVIENPGVGPDVLLPIRHPQLDGVNRSLIVANRNGIAVLGSTYQELEARKLGLRAVLAQGREPGSTLDDALDATINGIAALYIWEVHKGARPKEIGRVRSWSVRDWMKEQGFRSDAFPGLHLRDEVVERLRMYGIDLTPRPLTHTAWEYYSMQYDRYADERAPLGVRRSLGEGLALGGLFSFLQRKQEEPVHDDDAADYAPAYAPEETLDTALEPEPIEVIDTAEIAEEIEAEVEIVHEFVEVEAVEDVTDFSEDLAEEEPSEDGQPPFAPYRAN